MFRCFGIVSLWLGFTIFVRFGVPIADPRLVTVPGGGRVLASDLKKTGEPISEPSTNRTVSP